MRRVHVNTLGADARRGMNNADSSLPSPMASLLRDRTGTRCVAIGLLSRPLDRARDFPRRRRLSRHLDTCSNARLRASACTKAGGTMIRLVVSAVAIYAACEFFVNGVEWLVRKAGVTETAVGTILAAFGTALPESVVTLVGVAFGHSAASKEIGIGAALGGPLVLSTIAYAVVGGTIWALRGHRHSQHLAIDRPSAPQSRPGLGSAHLRGQGRAGAGRLDVQALAGGRLPRRLRALFLEREAPRRRGRTGAVGTTQDPARRSTRR